MGLIDLFKGIAGSETKRNLFIRIPPDRVKGAEPDTQPLVAGTHYFRLALCEMCLARDRKWFTQWYPAVHSVVRLTYGTQRTELPFIAGPLDLPEVKETNLDKVLHLNRKLTPLLPFNGGDIELTAGLLAMKSGDYLESFVGVLSNLSGLIAVPQFSAALAVAGPIAESIQGVLVGESGEPALGLRMGIWGSDGGGANEPVPGYFGAVVATETDLPPTQLHVIDDRLKRGPSVNENSALQGFTYMLFRLDKVAQRDDWEAFADLVRPFNAAVEALGDGYPERAESLLRAGAAAVLQSPDLTWTDRVRVARQLKDRYDQAVELGKGAVPGDLPDLPQLMSQAPALGKLTTSRDVDREYEELFGR